MARTTVNSKTSGFVVLASTSLVIAGLYLAKEVLIPIALAVLVSFLLAPAVRRLERMHVPRTIAMLICVTFAVGLVGGIGYVVYHQVTSIVESLPKYESQLHEKFRRFSQHGGIVQKVEKEAAVVAGGPATQTAAPTEQQPVATSQQWTPENPLPTRSIPQPTKSWELLRDFAGTVLSPLATGTIVLVLVCFMLLSREDLRDRVIRLLGSGRLNLTTQALDEASSRISSYLGALSIVNFCFGAIIAGSLWLIGKLLGHGTPFPNVLVWGILVGVLRFVPYVGVWIGASFPLLLAFALFPGNAVFFASLGTIAGLEMIVGQFIEPFWYGSSTGMSALAVLVSAVFWTWLWGPIGLLLSTPLTVILVVMGKYVPQLKFIDILLREEPVLSPPFRVYQRLLAGEQEEAAELARGFLREYRSLVKVYDEILIPVLSMAGADLQREHNTTEQASFVQQSVRDIAEELTDQFKELLDREQQTTEDAGAVEMKPAMTLQSVAETVSNMAAMVTGSGKSPAPRPAASIRSLPEGCSATVLCLAAKDQADETAAYMLAQALELSGYCAVAPSAATLASEVLEMIEPRKVDLVCVLALPPAAVAHSRYLCKRIHARFSDLSMLVGLLASKIDLESARDRIACSQSVKVVKTLADAIDQVNERLHHKAVQSASTTTAAAPKTSPDATSAVGPVALPG